MFVMAPMSMDIESEPSIISEAAASLVQTGAVGSTASVVSKTTESGTIKLRSPIACRRCRRMRSKCIHDKGTPPCQACAEAGLVAADCIFPVRGQPDLDRDFRHPRQRAEKIAKRDGAKTRKGSTDAPADPKSSIPDGRAVSVVSAADAWTLLPPREELVEAVRMFTTHFFQLGFLPKESFIRRLEADDLSSFNVFLLLSILSISARFTPSLKQRYGSGLQAVEEFMQRASDVALAELYSQPSLEKCQAFYLLAIAQKGSGLNNRSWINMAIAMRMATLMGLHREETYALPTRPSEELVTRAESARRTLWMLHSQDNLYSGPSSPVFLLASDITTLLPCEEKDFAMGSIPAARAALEGTPPALERPGLVSHPRRSLFASLIQVHNFWGTIARRAMNHDQSSRPWEAQSDYAVMAKRLLDWENSLPLDHTWSEVLLSGYKAINLDLAYLAVTMATQLCNIVIRKAYLRSMIRSGSTDPGRAAFWRKMALDLFNRVRSLHTQIKTHFGDAAQPSETGAQMAAFCVYSCGLLSCYLYKYPKLDPSGGRDGAEMLATSMAILRKSQSVWPLAQRWLEGLERFSQDKEKGIADREGSMSDGHDPIPRALHPPLPSQPVAAVARSAVAQQDVKPALAAARHRPLPVVSSPQNIDPTMRLPPPQPQILPPVSAPQYQPVPPPMQPIALAATAAASVPAEPPYDGDGYGAPPSRLSMPFEAYGPGGQAGGSSSNIGSGSGGMLPSGLPGGGPMPPPPPQPNLLLSGPRDAYGPYSQHPQHQQFASPAPLMVPHEDGYEDELQFYIDGSGGALPGWGVVPNGSTSMYGY